MYIFGIAVAGSIYDLVSGNCILVGGDTSVDNPAAGGFNSRLL